MQALAHIKEAKNKKIKAQNIYLKGAIFDVLNKVEVLLQELASKQAAVDKYNETGDVLFRIDKIVQYLK